MPRRSSTKEDFSNNHFLSLPHALDRKKATTPQSERRKSNTSRDRGPSNSKPRPDVPERSTGRLGTINSVGLSPRINKKGFTNSSQIASSVKERRGSMMLPYRHDAQNEIILAARRQSRLNQDRKATINFQNIEQHKLSRKNST